MSQYEVLVVDDNATNLKMLFRHLKKGGYGILQADSGEEALEVLKNTVPDIILLDVYMPGSDGFDLIKQIKRLDHLLNIPIIFMTAFADIDKRIKGLKLGAVDFIIKPIEAEELKAKINNHIINKTLKMEIDTYARVLEHEIAEKAVKENELLLAKEEAEEANKLKEHFLNTVSHDLISPLNRMDIFLQWISRDIKKTDQKEYLQLAVKSCEEMNLIIKELLNIQNIKEGKLKSKYKLFNVKLVIDQSLELYSIIAKQKKIEIKNNIAGNTLMYANENLVREITRSLISCSVNFCSDGDIVEIFISKDDPSLITVKDSSNIKPKYRGSTLLGSDRTEKANYGYSFIKEILEAHGGQFIIDDSKSNENLFNADFPVSRPRVMLIEDSGFVRKLVKKMLNNHSIDLIEEISGEDALYTLEQDVPHAILVDFQLPGIDGLEVLEKIKENINLAAVPVMMITGDVNIETRDKAFELGALDFINKPFKEEDIVSRIRHIISYDFSSYLMPL